MNKLSLITGLATVIAAIPLAASAASPYCGDRVCHSYDSSGACTNYTCFGNNYGYGSNYGNNYRNNCRYDSGLRGSYRYNSNSNRNCGYNYNNYNNRNYNNRNYNNRYYYDSRYDNRYNYNNTYYGNNRRPSRSSYYQDDWYYPNYDDRIYVPKAGYYYRY
ncbi:TPA: hypothetical protein DE059_04775 [Candidatus Peribacteria bacterium]|nr:hypothetical protein [Candidatus Peribacteria bacterium]